MNSLQQSTSLNHNVDESRARDDSSTATDSNKNDHSNGRNISSSTTTSDSSGTFARSSTSDTSSASREEALSLAHSYEERARRFREKAQQLTDEANYAESHNLQMSENLSQELAEWYRRYAAKNPGLAAPGLHEVVMDQHQRDVRDGLIAKFLEDRREAIHDEVAPYLKEPDLAPNVTSPAVQSEDDVRAMYHPLQLRSGPRLGSASDGSAITPAIDAGKKEIEAAETAKRYMRGQSVIGGMEVQGEVNKALDKGFFRDPKLRE